MLLFIFIIIIIITSFVIARCDEKFWHTELFEIMGIIVGVLASVALFVITGVVVSTLCTAPSLQASYEEEYSKLLKKVEHIDSFNCEEITQQVNEWNRQYRENSYAQQSPWVNWFCPIDTSTTSLIELKTKEDSSVQS